MRLPVRHLPVTSHDLSHLLPHLLLFFEADVLVTSLSSELLRDLAGRTCWAIMLHISVLLALGLRCPSLCECALFAVGTVCLRSISVALRDVCKLINCDCCGSVLELHPAKVAGLVTAFGGWSDLISTAAAHEVVSQSPSFPTTNSDMTCS